MGGSVTPNNAGLRRPLLRRRVCCTAFLRRRDDFRRRGLKTNPAEGNGFRFARRRARRRGAALRERERLTVLRLRRTAILLCPFFLLGFAPTIAKWGFSMNGSPS
jgi:hypothetical protein